MVMLRLWLNSQGNKATGNELEKVLRANGREDIVAKCIGNNLEVIQDREELELAKSQVRPMEDSGFDTFKVSFDSFSANKLGFL